MRYSFHDLLFILFTVLVSFWGSADVAILGAASTADEGNANTFSFNVTVPPDTELAVVGISNAGHRKVNSVTMGSQAFTTGIRSTDAPGDERDGRAELWYLVNPPAGAQTISADMTGASKKKAIGCLFMSGVNLSALSGAPKRAIQGRSGDNTNPSISFSNTETPAGSVVVSVIGYDSENLSIRGSGYIEQWNIKASQSFADHSRHGCSTLAGTSLDTITAAWETPKPGALSKDWGMVAMVVPSSYFGIAAIDPDTLSVNDNDPNDTLVGTLHALDSDNKPPYVWTLINNAGGRFKLSPSNTADVQVRIADTTLLDAGQHASHTIRVGARNDQYPGVFEKDILIEVEDTTAPKIGTASASIPFGVAGSFVIFSAEISDNAALDGLPTMTLEEEPLVFYQQDGDLFSWGWNVPVNWPDGPIAVRVTAQDTAGNETSKTTEDCIIIDNTKPTISGLQASHSYAREGDMVVVSVHIQDQYGIAPSPSLEVAGIDCGLPDINGNVYTWAVGISSVFPEGPVDLVVTAEDFAANQAQGVGAAFLTIDFTPPIIAAISSSRMYAKLNDTVTFQAAVIDNFGLNALPKMFLNGSLLAQPTAAGSSYYWHCPITAAVAQGSATLEVQAVDLAGNQSSLMPASTLLIVDYTQPSISSLQVAPQRAKGGTSLTLSAQVIDNYGLQTPPTMRINGNSIPEPSHSGYIYTWKYVVPTTPLPPEGAAEITISAVDFAGNTYNYVNTNSLTLDPNPPVFSNPIVTPAMLRAGQTTLIDVPVYDISPIGGTPVLLVNGVSALYGGYDELEGFNKMLHFSFTCTSATLQGDAELTLTAADTLGNSRTVSYTDYLLIDKTPPLITNIAVSPSISRAGGTVAITFDAEDLYTEVEANPTVIVNGAQASYYSRLGSHYTYRYTLRNSTLDPDGFATIFVACRDILGNAISQQNSNKLFIDNSKPLLSNLVVFPDKAKEGTKITIGFTAWDEHGLGAVPIVKVNGNSTFFSRSEGSTFEYSYTVRQTYDEEGYATLEMRVVDAIGNVLLSESTGLLLVDFTAPTGSVIINNNAVFTRSADVLLSVNGADGTLGSGVQGMSFSDDGVNWSAWVPYAATHQWQLKGGQGYKTVYLRLRDQVGNTTVHPISDTIVLKSKALTVDRDGSPEVNGLKGDGIVLEVTPRNVFGSVQSYEWFKDGQTIEGFGPTLVINNFDELDSGHYVCKVTDEIESAVSQPFVVGLSEENQVPTLSYRGVGLLCAVLIAAALVMFRRSRPLLKYLSLAVLLGWGFSAAAEVVVVYSARASSPMDLSDDAMDALAREQGAIEIWTRLENGESRREPVRFGEPGVGLPGFTSYQREGFADEMNKGLPITLQKDGTEELYIPLSDEATRVYSQNMNKGLDTPSFEMKLIVDGDTLVSEKRFETFEGMEPRPHRLRLDYPGGAIVQLFDYTDTPPTPMPPAYLRKVGTDDDEKSDVTPKSWVTEDKDAGDVQTREVQFVVPPQGLGNLGFDSGWVPGGTGPDAGGFIIQVRINAQAGYTFDAAVNGAFHLDSDDMLGLGAAAGNWGFYFGAEFFMKAAFDIPPILGFDLDPFVVDIPYVPDFKLVASDRDSFNSWLLDSESVVRDGGGRTNVVNLNILSLLLSQGVLPDLPSWVPLPKVGVSLDVGAIAEGHLRCDRIALSDGQQYVHEGQQRNIYVPPFGYQSIVEYREDAHLNLGVKFYPFVYFSWDLYVFDFGYKWPTDFDNPDNLLARLEWLPVSHTSFPFTNAELNFTGQPSTLPANDWFTEMFTPVIRTNDISHHQIRFTPNLSNNFYSACSGPTTAYRTDLTGGIPVSLGDDDFVKISLTDNKQVSLYGVNYDSFYIGSNGYLTFNTGDTSNNITLENHFNQPRISGLFLNLDPSKGGTISYKQLPNRMVVTYDHVHLANIITEQTANFQIEMFFDGRIVITWLQQDTYIGLIGLSRGSGVPQLFKNSDFTQYPGCLTEIAPEYGIRVNFEPPEVLPYGPRWRVGSGEWRSTGTYTSVPLGASAVYFNYISLYWDAPVTIITQQMTPDVFVDLTPVWKRATGRVNVSPQPATASWVVTDEDGGVYTGTGPSSIKDVPTGMVSIEWLPLSTYETPSPNMQQALLYGNMVVDFTANYAPIIGEGTASLLVSILPQKAKEAGAQWRANEGPWINSDVIAPVPDGDITIEFKELPGWTQPTPINIFLNRDTSSVFTRAYARHTGRIRIVTEPPNAPWYFIDGDGIQHVGSGERVFYEVPTGNALRVSWAPVPTYSVPVPNPTVFSLAQNEGKRIVGAYIPITGIGEGVVSVNLHPPAAIDDGARWRLFGDEWRVSGGMVAVTDGEQTILFEDIPGWITPEPMTVNVVRDITNTFDAEYVRITGTVEVEVTPANASWTLTDADEGIHTYMGNAVIENVPAGELSIYWEDLDNYEAPQPNPAVYVLEADETLKLSGSYTESILTVDFNAFPLYGPPPLEVSFQDLSHSTTKDIVEWRWYFGDGKVSTERNPTHVYRDVGTYTVTLTAVTFDKMDMISKKQLVSVTAGVPASGVFSLTLAAVVVAVAGMFLLRRKGHA